MFSVDHNEAEEGLRRRVEGGGIMQGAILLTISFCPQRTSQLLKSFPPGHTDSHNSTLN